MESVMSTLLPTALAVALAQAHARYIAKGDPGIPFIPHTRQGDPRQVDALPAAPVQALAWPDWKAQLLAQAGAMLPYLRHSPAELHALAQRLPDELAELSVHEARATEDERLVAAAERRFDEPVPGETPATQAARVRDAKYWRRFLKQRVRQARERLHLALGLVGKGGRQYCSEGARAHRQMQLRKQAEWLKTTVLRGTVGGRVVEIPLEQVAKGPKQKLAKLYAFIAAMNELAVEAGLTVALLTTTLEGEWHANPSHASEGHRWNGKMPAEANKELGRRFQAVRRDLDKCGIALSGLWCGEPHADGCPHRHHWLMYHPDHERTVLAVFLKHFPGKLKLRRGEDEGGDVIIETSEDARKGVHRKCHRNEGAQVDVSIIDQAKSSGASYILKYVLKAVLPELSIEGAVTPLGPAKPQAADGEPASEGKTGGKRKRAPRTKAKPSAAEARKQLRALQSIDAHRAVWRMRSFQFFGVKNCLTLWDELRRLKEAPCNPELRRLWLLARGGDIEGRLHTGEQHGDAYGFLKAMGGLAAAPVVQEDLLDDDSRGLRARVYSEPTTTRYGETGARIKGIELVQRAERERGEKDAPREQVLDCVVTRHVKWELVPKESKAKAGTKVGAAVPGKGKTTKPS
jgi:hypothetical protein